MTCFRLLFRCRWLPRLVDLQVVGALYKLHETKLPDALVDAVAVWCHSIARHALSRPSPANLPSRLYDPAR